MRRIFLPYAIFIVISLGLLLLPSLKFEPPNRSVSILGTTVPPIPSPDIEVVAKGKVLYDHYCANCHGSNLEGVSNWKVTLPDGSLLPPPQDSNGHTWHHTDKVLIQIISEGGDPAFLNTKMPGFGNQLKGSEIESILEYIKSHWGQEEQDYQWWLTTKDELN